MSAFKNLRGKRALITGAASGIGYEMAIAFAREGVDIIALDLQEEALGVLTQSIESIGCSCRSVVLDVTDAAAFKNLFANLASNGEFPDIVVNNAGIGFMGDFLNTDNSMWQRVLDINVVGVINGCRAFLETRGESNAPGVIINFASAASIAPMPNMSAYAASKYAVEGLSEVLAMELEGSSVKVMCVHPGVINTPIVKHPELTRISTQQLEKLQDYYTSNGAPPATVADAVVAGVKSGSGNVFTGPSMSLTVFLKHLLPRSWFRRVLLKNAREIGYL